MNSKYVAFKLTLSDGRIRIVAVSLPEGNFVADGVQVKLRQNKQVVGVARLGIVDGLTTLPHNADLTRANLLED